MLRAHRRTRIVAMAACLVMLVSGCGLGANPPSTGSGQSGSGPTTTAPATSAAPAALPDKPAKVTFDTPAGFSESTAYRILVPLHPDMTTKWVLPTGSTSGDIVAVVSYLLDEDVSKASDADLTKRLQRYAAKVSAVSASTPVKSTVAGQPAFTQDIEQPGGTKSVTYQAVFVFSGPYMVELICQYATQRDLIMKACGTVRDSLKIATT